MIELFVSACLYSTLTKYFYHVTYAFRVNLHSVISEISYLKQLNHKAQSFELKQIQIRTRIK